MNKRIVFNLGSVKTEPYSFTVHRNINTFGNFSLLILQGLALQAREPTFSIRPFFCYDTYV